MQYFTPEEIRPSEQTLNVIRQFAYSYRTDPWTGETDRLCLN